MFSFYYKSHDILFVIVLYCALAQESNAFCMNKLCKPAQVRTASSSFSQASSSFSQASSSFSQASSSLFI